MEKLDIGRISFSRGMIIGPDENSSRATAALYVEFTAFDGRHVTLSAIPSYLNGIYKKRIFYCRMPGQLYV